MLVVPLKNDRIENKDGVTFVVLSYTNYRERGPAVYVEHTPAVPSDAVYFFDIARINGKHVDPAPGKVFKSIGPLQRRWQLPQPNDIVTYRGPTGSAQLVVKGLKLHKRGDLAKGLLLVGVDPDTDEQAVVPLRQIRDLHRDLGNDMFSREKFLSYYSDYLGATK